MADPNQDGPLVVARDHPLNRGRVLWWLVAPEGSGGARWPDLMGRAHGYQLGASRSCGFRGTTRPGGRGHFLADGTGRVRADPLATPLLATGSPHSAAAWAFVANPGIGPQQFLGYGDGSAHAGINLGYHNDTGRFGAYKVSDGGEVAVAALPAASAWLHAAYTWDGSASRLYLNGVPAASAATAPESAGVTAVAAGENIHTGFPERPSAGAALDDLGLWGRSLSAAEVAALYDLSRRGYAGALVRPRRSWAAVPAAGVLPVQGAGVQSGGSVVGGQTLAATFAAPTVVGNTIALAVAGSGPGAPAFTVTDSKGNSWTQRATITNGSNTRLSIYTAPIATGGASHSVSVSPSINALVTLGILECSGADATAPLDGSATAGPTTSASPSSGSVPVAGPGELVFGAAYIGSSATATAGTGFTARYVAPGGSNLGLIVEDQAGLASATAATFNLSASATWLAAGISLKAPATQVADADSATAAAAPTLLAAYAGSDSAASAQAQALAGAYAGADSAASAATSVLLATAADSDSGAGAESAILALAGATDAAAGTEVAAVVALAAGSDSGAGGESASATAGLAGVDSAVGSESAAVGVGPTSLADADSATAAAAAALLAAYAGSDSGASAVAGTTTVAIAGADSGVAGASAVLVAGGTTSVVAADSAHATESASVVAAGSAGTPGVQWAMPLSTSISLQANSQQTAAASSVETFTDLVNIPSTALLLGDSEAVAPSNAHWSGDVLVPAGGTAALDLTALPPRPPNVTVALQALKFLEVTLPPAAAGPLYLAGGANAWLAPWPASAGAGAGAHVEEVPRGWPFNKGTAGAGWAVGPAARMLYLANPGAAGVTVKVFLVGVSA